MKFLKVISFIIVLATVVSCKKDHPNDIPNWVKNAIKEFKRDGNSHDIKACADNKASIEEYSYNLTGEIFYSFKDSDSPAQSTLYDKDGNKMCNPSYAYYMGGNNTYYCGSYMLKDFTYKRTIWTASCQ